MVTEDLFPPVWFSAWSNESCEHCRGKQTHTVQLESSQTPSLFPHFVTLQPKIYTQYPIMTKQKQAFRNVCKRIIKKLQNYIYTSLQTLYSVLCWSTLAALTTSSLLGHDATSLAHLYLGSFSHSSLQILSSSVRLDGKHRCIAIFRSLQRYSSPDSGWATQSCPEATPALSWLCA